MESATAPLTVPDMRAADCEFTLSLTDGVHRITRGGAYHVRGQATGQLVIDAKGSDVTLLLDDAALTSPDGPALHVLAASHVYLIAAEGTRSTLTDSPTYTLPEGEDEPNAAIFSKADLSVGGTGELLVVGQYADGIASKDGLTLAGSIAVTAADDAIRGKDHVTVAGGALRLNAGGDGIKSTSEGGDDLGWVLLRNSDVVIVSGADGVQAVTSVTMESGSLDITSGGGWDEAHRQQLAQPLSKREREARGSSEARDVRAANGTGARPTATPAPTEGSGGKGVKARVIHVTGGKMTVSARDDALHAGESVFIEGGVLVLASNDDGIHSDDALTISGGDVSVTDAYEGLEAAHILASGGTTSVRAIDDGWNAASKAVTEAAGKRKTYDFNLVISGGQHRVIAGADALDSNGDILISGGVTFGASSNESKEVPLDYPKNRECRVTGGIVALSGAYGKNTQTFNAADNQASLLLKWRTRQAADTLITVQDAQGGSVLSLRVPAAFQALIVSCPGIQVGGAYRVLTNDAPSGVRTVSEPAMFFPVTERKTTTNKVKRTPTPSASPAP